MTNRVSMPEILAPAGTWESLHAALDAGCHAVYFGVGELNMRATALNFDEQSIPALVRRCHHRGCKAYLTLNTLIYDREFSQVDQILVAARDAGVDAVIASDVAVIESSIAHGLDVHISTQMSVSNSRTLLFFHQNFGIRRFVLARECTLEDMAIIRSALVTAGVVDSIELEVFAHGAMCVSISGRCFMSQFNYGKSANRGMCLQPCRREFKITATDEDLSFDLGSDYVLSPQDLCTLPFLEKLIEAGVSSIKIEGRGRSPEYVGAVTRAYREVAEYYCRHRTEDGFDACYADLKADHLQRIQRVYHRGFSNGFYMGKPLDAWVHTDGSLATTHKEYAGIVTNFYRKTGAAEVLIHGHEVRFGDSIYFIGKTTGVVEQRVDSMQVDGVSVPVAHKGMAVAIKTEQKVRRQDKIYVIVEHEAV